MLLFSAEGNELTLSLREAPGFLFLKRTIADGLKNKEEGGVLAFLLERIDLERILFRAQTVFSPTLRLGAAHTCCHTLSNTAFSLPDGVGEVAPPSFDTKEEEVDAPPRFFRFLRKK